MNWQYLIGCFVAGAIATLVIQSLVDTSSEQAREAQNNISPSIPLSGAAKSEGVKYLTNLRAGYKVISGHLNTSTFDGPVVQAATIAYSEYFARAYGYPETYVAPELPDFVDYIAYEIKYAGSFQKCQLKLLIDKGSLVQVPDAVTSSLFFGGNTEMFRAPLPPRLKSHGERAYQRDFRLTRSTYANYGHYALNNFQLVGEGKSDSPDARASLTLPMVASDPGVFEEWNFVTLAFACSELAQNLLEHDRVLLKMRPSTDVDTRANIDTRASKPTSVRLPLRLKQRALRILHEIEF